MLMIVISACITATYKLAVFIQQMNDFTHIDLRCVFPTLSNPFIILIDSVGITDEMSRVIPPNLTDIGILSGFLPS